MMYQKLTQRESDILNMTADQIGVNAYDLYRLIDFESGWNPRAENPNSSARGLIQFIDSTAIDLGFRNSDDLVDKNPTITDQLPIVKQYLSRFMPFYTKQQLYMSVFYPAARNWNSDKLFPSHVIAVNPGIDTVQSYIDRVDNKKNVKIPFSAVALAAAAFFF